MLNVSFALSLDSIGCSTFSVHTYILTPEHEQEFIETANECSAKAVQKTLTQQRKELDKAQNRISELNILFRKLYEDNALGKLSDEQFDMLPIKETGK